MARSGDSSLLYDKEVTALERQIEGLKDYCQMKLTAEDWHAVSDAANDLRELEAELRVYDCLFEETLREQR